MSDSRQYVLAELEKRYANPVEETWETRDFHCRELAVDNYLLTYTLIQGAHNELPGPVRGLGVFFSFITNAWCDCDEKT